MKLIFTKLLMKYTKFNSKFNRTTKRDLKQWVWFISLNNVYQRSRKEIAQKFINLMEYEGNASVYNYFAVAERFSTSMSPFIQCEKRKYCTSEQLLFILRLISTF